MKLFVSEFAENRQEIERELKSKTWPIIKHLAKCLIMKDSNTYNHWKKEIVNFIDHVDKLKGKNKLPNKTQIFDWTYGKVCDCMNNYYLTNFFHELEDDYSMTIYTDYETLTSVLDKLCYSYFTFLADNLSTYGYLDKRKANDLIDDYVHDSDIDVEEK